MWSWKCSAPLPARRQLLDCPSTVAPLPIRLPAAYHAPYPADLFALGMTIFEVFNGVNWGEGDHALSSVHQRRMIEEQVQAGSSFATTFTRSVGIPPAVGACSFDGVGLCGWMGGNCRNRHVRFASLGAAVAKGMRTAAKKPCMPIADPPQTMYIHGMCLS